MTAEIGQAAIYLSVLSCLWAIGFLSFGLRIRNARAIQSGRNAVVATFILTSIATGALIYGFVTDDFSMRYVVEVSSAAQPLFYKIAALWGCHVWFPFTLAFRAYSRWVPLSFGKTTDVSNKPAIP